MNKEILVSVICITYNHEKYIRECLDSILKQKVNFNYELIIHDDASSDNTVNIINEYKEKYKIIKPILQKENQYSKGKKASKIAVEQSVGKYIAICEGDDYWYSNDKLQKQIDYMEKNKDCKFCFTDYYLLNQKDMSLNKKMIISDKNKFNAGELDSLGAIATASYVIRRDSIIPLPEWYESAISGDIALELISTSRGYAYHINEPLVVYRVGTGTSLMDKWRKDSKDKNKEIERLNRVINFYININEYTNYKYNHYFKKSISRNKALSYLLDKNLYKSELKKIKKDLSNRMKIRLFIGNYFPSLYKKIERKLYER